MLGEFNIVMDPKLDHSNIVKTLGILSNLQFVIYQYNLKDAWRQLRGQMRDFTLHSGRHQFYSRTDMNFVNEEIMQGIE